MNRHRKHVASPDVIEGSQELPQIVLEYEDLRIYQGVKYSKTVQMFPSPTSEA